MQFSSMSSLGSSDAAVESRCFSNTTRGRGASWSFAWLRKADDGASDRGCRRTRCRRLLNGDLKRGSRRDSSTARPCCFSQIVLPLTVARRDAAGCFRPAPAARLQAAGVIEILHQVLARSIQIDQRVHAAASRSKSSRSRSTPMRRARASDGSPRSSIRRSPPERGSRF